MATRFYLLDTTNYVTNGPSSEQSTVLPLATDNSLAWALRDMDESSAASPVSLTANYQDIVTTQSALFRAFISPPLAAQTIAAQNWSIAADANVSNSRLTIQWALNIYVWRPSTTSKVGAIYDSSTGLGTAWSTSPTTQTGTAAGASLAISNNDKLVVEVWSVGGPNKTTAYDAVVDYNDANSYLSWTHDITLYTPPSTAPTSVLRAQSIFIE